MLGCESEKGRKHIAYENRIADIICETMNVEQVIPDSNKCQIDRYFFRDNDLVATAEIKTRNLSLSELRNFGSYLITFKKINTGRAFSALTGVPYFLFVGLIKEKKIYYWKVADEHGEFVVDMEISTTKTKEDVNGGLAFRENAFLSLKGMKEFEK